MWVEVHLLASGGVPVIGPAPVLHPVDQTHQVLAVGLQVVAEGTGVLAVHHDKLTDLTEHHEVKHRGLRPEEELLVTEHLTQCQQILLAEVLDLLGCVDSHAVGAHSLQSLRNKQNLEKFTKGIEKSHVEPKIPMILLNY